MALKQDLLEQLMKHQDVVYSGEDLARHFHVTRAAIWKAIKALKEEGVEIDSLNGKGYTFKSSNDLLSLTNIQEQLKDLRVEVLESVDSTNNYIKRLAINKDFEEILVIANQQTNGRGRRGHDFYSPASTGLYMSYGIRPKAKVEKFLRLTIAAAVSCRQAIHELTGVETDIKWVNDLYLNKEKVAGILCEATYDFESQDVDSLIIGIGINTSTSSFPEEITGKAGHLPVPVSRNELAVAIVKRLRYWLDHLQDEELIKEYRKASMILMKDIEYEKDGLTYKAKAIDINDEGNLVVIRNGQEDILTSGEVRLSSF